MVQYTRNRRIRLANGNFSPLYLRKPCSQRLGDVESQRFDQIALTTGDNVFNDSKGDTVMHSTVDIVILQRIARIDIENSIDVETLTELVLFIENAVVRENAQFIIRIVYTASLSVFTTSGLQDIICNGKCISIKSDIVDTEDVGTCQTQCDRRCCGSYVAVERIVPACHAADKTFARRADEQRKSEFCNSPALANNAISSSLFLPKPKPGSSTMRGSQYLPFRYIQRNIQERELIFDDIGKN